MKVLGNVFWVIIESSSAIGVLSNEQRLYVLSFYKFVFKE